MRPSYDRLNPFVLPSETRVRFTLLMLTAIFLTLNLGFILADQLGLPSPATISSQMLAANGAPAPGTVSQAGGATAYQRYLETNLALLHNLLAIVRFPLELTLAMLTLAFVLYRLHPRWIRASGKVRTHTPSLDPEMADMIGQLAAIAQPPAAWQVELVGTFQTSNIRVFGFPKGYTLRIGSLWRVVLRRSPEMFRSVILHEFAHIVNGDIHRTYFSQALWIALLGAMILLLGVGYLLTQTLGVEVQRAALADLAGASGRRWPYLRLLFPAVLTRAPSPSQHLTRCINSA